MYAAKQGLLSFLILLILGTRYQQNGASPEFKYEYHAHTVLLRLTYWFRYEWSVGDVYEGGFCQDVRYGCSSLVFWNAWAHVLACLIRRQKRPL